MPIRPSSRSSHETCEPSPGSVRLKTTFGSAHQTSANAALGSLSRNDGSVSHTSIASYSLRPNR
jgi:hypothetical protein